MYQEFRIAFRREFEQFLIREFESGGPIGDLAKQIVEELVTPEVMPTLIATQAMADLLDDLII